MNDEQARLNQVFWRVQRLFKHNPEQLKMITTAFWALKKPDEVVQLEKKLNTHGEPLDFDTAIKLIEQCYRR